MPAGVYPSVKKDGTPYWRASVTHKGKHISLGGFDSQSVAGEAYLEACSVLRGEEFSSDDIGDISDRGTIRALPFAKLVALINFRDNGIWCRGPIYLRKGYFEYYLSPREVVRFGPDDLFYFTHHSLQKRGGHLFVADYGMQVSVLSRYGVRAYAVAGRDYYFKNGDALDFRPGNLVIVNHYTGVTKKSVGPRETYTARINVPSGSSIVVGHYDTEREAAIAYNKAVDILRSRGCTREYATNYIEDISTAEYRIVYAGLKVRKAIREIGL